MRTNEQGRSMIEMLGVLAIVGVLSVGGIAGYSKAMNKFKTNKAIDQVNMIATSVRTLYSSQSDYEGLTSSLAKKAGIIPAEMYSASDASNSDLVNAFNGEAQVKVDATDKGNFTVTINNIPRDSCVTILTTDWGGTESLTEIRADSTSASDITALETGKKVADGSDDYPFPTSISNANANCGSASTITWVFK